MILEIDSLRLRLKEEIGQFLKAGFLCGLWAHRI